MFNPPVSRSFDDSEAPKTCGIVQAFPQCLNNISRSTPSQHANNNLNGNSSASDEPSRLNCIQREIECLAPSSNRYSSSNSPSSTVNSLLPPSSSSYSTTNNISNHNSSFKCVSQSYSPPPSPTPLHKNSIGTSPIPLASGPEVTSDPNWQATKANVRERNAAMFNNDLMSDITFIVGPKGCQQKIPAHKYVLATGSAVFFAMFYGGLAENRNEIEIPDVEPTAFFALLRYIYCDDICLEADSVLLTLYAAKKYLVPHLARACVEYLETSITARNACVLLNQSRLFEEPDLMKQCWEVIDAQAELALSSEGFTEIDFSTLETILNRETLNAKEASIFHATLDWAKMECSRRNIEPTPDNQRKILDKAIFLLRIPTMTIEEFANGPAQSGLLSLQETTDIFLYYTARNKPILSFPTKKRLGLKVQICHRFQSSAYRNNQWRYRGRCDSIQFTVDRRIFIVGFGLYGSSNASADYKVKMELKKMGKVLAEDHTKFFSDGSSNTFRVYFQHPIQVEAETFYTASVVLDGNELSFFGQDGLNEVTVDKVTFNFHVSSDSTNGTNVHGGQIPELLFYGAKD